jgi:hypothetical protein
MAVEPDGTLHDWGEIATAHKWDTLLLGNGLSINVWEPFGYKKLFDRARRGAVLTEEDRKLFSGTPNFERVLGDLLTAIRASEAIGLDPTPFYDRYRNIQLALGHAVREVHVAQRLVPVETRRAIRREMERFEWIFTTSYDLLIYWAIACDGKFKPFVDQFSHGSRLEFDPNRTWIAAGSKPLYFLHGALHLVTGSTGATWKLRQTRLDSLLNQFGKSISGDPRARPLFVTEGSAKEKLNAIEKNVYLSHALERLTQRELPVVVFGGGLGEHDSHITAALGENPGRPVAVSMLPGPKDQLFADQVGIYGRLKAKPLLFFDATTHPLGDQKLRVLPQ